MCDRYVNLWRLDIIMGDLRYWAVIYLQIAKLKNQWLETCLLSFSLWVGTNATVLHMAPAFALLSQAVCYGYTGYGC